MNGDSNKRKSKPANASGGRARAVKKPADLAPPSARDASLAHSNGSTGLPDQAERGADLNELIQEHAYRLYLSRGCQHGQALEHWLEAERQIKVSLHSERDQGSDETDEASRSR
jgi:hypothetical protein